MACNVTAKSGQSRGLEDALGATVKGKLEGKYWKKKNNSVHLLVCTFFATVFWSFTFLIFR